ncbi:sulfite exporter TauE/SafE family protein [Streptomyces sp. NPDC051940]|uniref:sulfite exporter TauE/SafE family protein n=1 Tax=Streptomyces sp. NPDC051940 TaxID=3155675 RepID=UPI00342D975C
MAGEIAVGAIVLVGASVQRLAGIGFALVCVPALVLLLGADEGVALCNLGAAAISAVGLAQGGAWREIRPQAMLPLLAAAACTVPVGAWVAHALPEPQLLTVIGVLVTVAVTAVIRGARIPALSGRGGAVAAGAASGFMNSSSGVGGPALSLYAVNAGWTVREFVPNAQLYGVAVNGLSIAAKGTPGLTRPGWLLVAAALAGGAVIGAVLADRIPERRARGVVLGLALLGGVTILGKGVWGW